VKPHPIDHLLRTDRIPHIWCAGCGIGIAANAFAEALNKSELDIDRVAVVSGIGCTGRVAGYLKLDSFHTTHGRAIPFATGLHMVNEDLKVVVFSGDGDLIAIGGNHFIHAARRNQNMLVLCVNNFNYSMTGGQLSPSTPPDARTSTSPFGNYEPPFNLPYLAEACGATYVARYSVYHVRHLIRSIREALNKKGFRFIEILSPCPTLYGRLNKLGDGLSMMRGFEQRGVVKRWAKSSEVTTGFHTPIITGHFVDIEKQTYREQMEAHYMRSLGSEYTPIQHEEDPYGD